MIKKIIILFFVFIITINFSSKISFGKNLEKDIYIYESPKIDYEEYLNDNHSFVNYNGLIYSINKNYLVIISRYYIPIKKIKIMSSNVLISSDGEFLYIFDNKKGKLYKYDSKKFYFVKRLNIFDIKCFQIYKDKFYFLKDKEIIISDMKFNQYQLKLDRSYLKFKIKKEKIYLSNEKEIGIFDLNGNKLLEKGISNLKIKSFDVDIDNKIYVLTNLGIFVFDENLNFIEEINLNKEGDEIFLDLSRAIVVYFKNEGIKVLPPKFDFKVIENLTYPSDLTIDENGNLYILNTKNSEILVYNKDLKLINRFGYDVLKYPKGIYFYKDKIYVADSWNNKIRIFNKNGELIFSFGNYGNNEKEFNYPLKVKVYNDLIYVLDVYNHKLKVFDLNGNYLISYGENPKTFLLSLIKPKETLFEANEFDIYNNYILITDKATYELIIYYERKIKRIKSNDLITKIMTYNENLYLLGNRWKYIYKLKNEKIVPVFSLSYNYYDKFKNLKPYSLLVSRENIYILDKDNGKLYIIEGVIDE